MNYYCFSSFPFLLVPCSSISSQCYSNTANQIKESIDNNDSEKSSKLLIWFRNFNISLIGNEDFRGIILRKLNELYENYPKKDRENYIYC